MDCLSTWYDFSRIRVSSFWTIIMHSMLKWLSWLLCRFSFQKMVVWVNWCWSIVHHNSQLESFWMWGGQLSSIYNRPCINVHEEEKVGCIWTWDKCAEGKTTMNQEDDSPEMILQLKGGSACFLQQAKFTCSPIFLHQSTLPNRWKQAQDLVHLVQTPMWLVHKQECMSWWFPKLAVF